MKLRRTFRGNLKAVSPVIATIIIVAIAITMSIAVAYWLLGLGSSFTKYEKVEFTTAYVTGTGGVTTTFTATVSTGAVTGTATGVADGVYPGTVHDGTDPYKITLNFKNTGSAAAKVDTAVTQYNGKPDTYYDPSGFTWAWTPATGMSMDPGAASSATITLPTTVTQGTGFVSGMTLEIMMHTTGGKDYPKVITLP